MITESDIDRAYKAREKAFIELAKAEDQKSDLETALADLKEGTPSYTKKVGEIRALMPYLISNARAFQRAQWEVDRIEIKAKIQFGK